MSNGQAKAKGTEQNVGGGSEREATKSFEGRIFKGGGGGSGTDKHGKHRERSSESSKEWRWYWRGRGRRRRRRRGRYQAIKTGGILLFPRDAGRHLGIEGVLEAAKVDATL